MKKLLSIPLLLLLSSTVFAVDLESITEFPFVECGMQFNRVFVEYEQGGDMSEIELTQSESRIQNMMIGKHEWFVPSVEEHSGGRLGGAGQEDAAYKVSIILNLHLNSSQWIRYGGEGSPRGHRLKAYITVSRRLENGKYKTVARGMRDSDEIWTKTQLTEVSANRMVQHVFRAIRNPEVFDYIDPQSEKYALGDNNDVLLQFEREGPEFGVEAAGQAGIFPKALFDNVNVFCNGVYRQNAIAEDLWLVLGVSQSGELRNAPQGIKDICEAKVPEVDMDFFTETYGTTEERGN